MQSCIRGWIAILVIAVGAWGEASFAQSGRIRGHVQVTDGDTLRMGDLRIRMHGMDAPEKAQICIKQGAPWQCGQASKAALVARIGAASVDCVVKDQDRYHRLVAECFLGAESINRWMVAQGWAVAYRQFSQDYVGAEGQARSAGRGIWSSQFEMPSEWRSARRHRR